MKSLTPEEAIEALDAISGDDPEGAHIEADAVLLAAVDESVFAAYERLQERAAGWWYA